MLIYQKYPLGILYEKHLRKPLFNNDIDIAILYYSI